MVGKDSTQNTACRQIAYIDGIIMKTFYPHKRLLGVKDGDGWIIGRTVFTLQAERDVKEGKKKNLPLAHRINKYIYMTCALTPSPTGLEGKVQVSHYKKVFFNQVFTFSYTKLL